MSSSCVSSSGAARPLSVTCRYHSSFPSTVIETRGSRRRYSRRLRPSSMFTSTLPSSHRYQEAALCGLPSGRSEAITDGFGCLRNSSSCGGSGGLGIRAPVYPRDPALSALVRERLVGPARLAAQARAGRQRGGHAHRARGQNEARGHRRRVRQPDGGLAAWHGAGEAPYRLVAARRRDRHSDARTRAVHVALVVERHVDLRVLALRQRRGVLASEARLWIEQRALLRVELALAGAQPAVLHERLLAVRAYLGDGHLQVHVARARADPGLQIAGADHGCVV